MMLCPDCKGDRYTIASHVRYADGTGASSVPLKCTRCDGVGQVPDEMAEWIRQGAAMREKRLAANRTLRAEAIRRGMTAMELSRMEFGKIEPIQEEEHR